MTHGGRVFYVTQWGRYKMAEISKTFSNAFSWMKIYEFRLICHYNYFPMVKLTISQNWFRYWLGTDQATSHYLNQWWQIYWRKYASFGLNELKCTHGGSGDNWFNSKTCHASKLVELPLPKLKNILNYVNTMGSTENWFTWEIYDKKLQISSLALRSWSVNNEFYFI